MSWRGFVTGSVLVADLIVTVHPGADLDKVLDFDITKLRAELVAAIDGRIAKAERANHCIGMNDDVLSENRILVEDGIRENRTARAELAAVEDSHAADDQAQGRSGDGGCARAVRRDVGCAGHPRPDGLPEQAHAAAGAVASGGIVLRSSGSQVVPCWTSLAWNIGCSIA